MLLANKIDLDVSVNSGQVFLWNKIGDVWYGINGQAVFKAVQNPLRITSSNKNSDNIFRTSDDMKRIFESICIDPKVSSAVLQYPGLRLLRQDPFQCYISFICSSNSSIPNIKRMLSVICDKFGEKLEFDNYDFNTFPEPEKLANANIKDLLSCGLGFRAKYVKKASEMVANGKIDFHDLKKLRYHHAKELLTEIYGIGNKIADCILLFSLEKLEAFPLDRWTMRILQKYYPRKFSKIIGKSLTKKKYEVLHEKIVEHFGPYAGYSQQFLFKMERELNNGKWL